MHFDENAIVNNNKNKYLAKRFIPTECQYNATTEFVAPTANAFVRI